MGSALRPRGARWSERAGDLSRQLYRRTRVAVRRVYPGPTAWDGVRLLGYHRVSDAADPLAVSPTGFREHLAAVLASGATPLRLTDAVELLRAPVTGRYFCVTLDDGYLDTYEVAAPILRSLRVPATVFLPTAIIDGDETYGWYVGPAPPSMTWGQVAELDAEGLIAFESHGRTHTLLPTLADEAAREEIVGSRRVLQERLGRAVTCFCYPAGRYTERDLLVVGAAGYAAAVTTTPGYNRGGTSLLTLHRTMVGPTEDRHHLTALFDGLLDAPHRMARAARRVGVQPRQAPRPERDEDKLS